MTELFQHDKQSLTPAESEAFLVFLTSDGLKIAQRIIRGKIAVCVVKAGGAAIVLLDGILGQQAELDERTALAVKLKHFLEVVEGLKREKAVVEKITNI